MIKRIMVHLTRKPTGQPKCGKHVPGEKRVLEWPNGSWRTLVCEDCFKYRNKRVTFIFNELLD
jgi:hypothetical protein